jgi:hypothetical protein
VLSTGIKAEEIKNTENECADILIAFARGSSDNQSHLNLDEPFDNEFFDLEEVPGAFFQAMQRELDAGYPEVTYKAVSVHNFPNLYNERGYRAVGIFGIPTVHNIVQAEFEWWPKGEYGLSVSDGVDEFSGYLKDQVALCPEQTLIVGGYSQGAQVAGESLFKLSDSERAKIGAVALFGDPKFLGSDINKGASGLNWFDGVYDAITPKKPEAKPWKRGTSTLSDRGMLEARIPYVPSDMEQKTISWCYKDDLVCAGWSGVLLKTTTTTAGSEVPGMEELGDGHKRYVNLGAPQTAEEIVLKLSQKLQSIVTARGGFNPGGTEITELGKNGSNSTISVMMMVNTSAGVDDVLGTMRFTTRPVLESVWPFFPFSSIGVGDYSELGQLPDKRIPRINIRQTPTKILSNLENAMYRKLSFGGPSGGGLDVPEPHQLAVEKAAMTSVTTPDTIKHVVLITDRPFHDTYLYNICNSDVRTAFGILEDNQCNIDPLQETASAVLHSERCKNAYQALTSTVCAVASQTPTLTYNVTRSKRDAATFAVLKDVAVTVVVPHGFYPGIDEAATERDLKKLASDTGGLYLKYPAFNKANYTNMLWKVLNHQPKRTPLAFLDDLNSITSESQAPFTKVAGKTNTPVQFSSPSPAIYDSYNWDFDGDGSTDESTYSPSAEHLYTKTVTETFASVVGVKDGVESSLGLLPVEITEGELRSTRVLPESPTDLTTTRSDDEIVIRWTFQDNEKLELLFVGDEAGVPMRSVPLNIGEIRIEDENSDIQNITVWVESEDGRSPLVELAIAEPDNNPPKDNRTPSDKILPVNESNNLPTTFSGAMFAVTLGGGTPASSLQSSSATAQDLQGAGVTQVRGAETTTNTNPQKTATLNQTTISQEIDNTKAPDQSANGFILPILGMFMVVMMVGGALYLLRGIRNSQ